MASPLKVLGFLRPFSFSGKDAVFDPSLAMIVLGGVVPNAVYWNIVEKGKARYTWETWRVPSRTDVDWRLIGGATMFGVGWGLAGVCPGPAIVGVGRMLLGSWQGNSVGATGTVIAGFMGSMTLGMGLAGLI